MKRTTRLIPAILLLLSLIVGCGNHQTSLPADAETPAVTQRPAATAVPAATEKPAAGEAPSATEEPQPEPEPEPAAMPEPEPEQDDLNLRRTAVNAYLDREQNAFIPCSDGSCIKIEDEAGVRMACLSPDEEQIVYITGDGMLYLTDRDLADKKLLEESAKAAGWLTDLGFFYMTSDGENFRYSFRDGGSVRLGRIDEVCKADDGFSLLYSRNGELYRLTAEGMEPEKLATADIWLRPLYLSADGKTVIWDENVGESYRDESAGSTYWGTTYEYRILACEGGTTRELGTMCGIKSKPEITVTKDGRLAVILCARGDHVLIWREGADPVQVELELPFELSAVYTANGPLEQVSSSDVRDLYLAGAADRLAADICSVTLEGKMERLIPRAEYFSVFDGEILWGDEDGRLFRGELTVKGVTGKKELDSNAGYLVGTYGQYSYFYRWDEDGMEELCAYRKGDAALVRIDSADTADGRDGVAGSFKASLHGDTFCYAKDIKEDYTGTLMTWTWDGEKRKIADDVCFYYGNSCSSGLADGHFVDPEGFWFVSDTVKETDRNVYYGTLSFWNGEETTLLASGVNADNS